MHLCVSTNQKVTWIQHLLCKQPALVNVTSWGMSEKNTYITSYFKLAIASKKINSYASTFTENKQNFTWTARDEAESDSRIWSSGEKRKIHQNDVNNKTNSHASLSDESYWFFGLNTDLPFSGWYKVAVSGQGSAAVMWKTDKHTHGDQLWGDYTTLFFFLNIDPNKKSLQ